MKLNNPKIWLDRAMFLLGIKLVWNFCSWLFNHRPSSNESRKERKELNKQIKEIKDTQLTKEDVRETMEKVCKNFITKDLFEERIKRIKEEITHDYDLKFIKIENLAKEQKREATGMKQQLRKVFEPMILEYHKINNKSKIKKQISSEVNSILENYDK